MRPVPLEMTLFGRSSLLRNPLPTRGREKKVNKNCRWHETIRHFALAAFRGLAHKSHVAPTSVALRHHFPDEVSGWRAVHPLPRFFIGEEVPEGRRWGRIVMAIGT